MDNFAQAIRGRIVRPADSDYEQVRRVYNGAIDRRPAMVVQCAGAQDVVHCVNYAREQNLPLAVRGGGHSAPGFGACDGGLVVDLSPMRGIFIDEGNRTVRVDGGCTWGDVDSATHAVGLAMPGGLISTTGVGGLATGGGFGYLSRRYGLVCDNLLSAEVVTADGQLRAVGPASEPDLFWAIRGGGGNFGIVTSFRFRLHPVSQVFAGPVLYSLDQAPDVLRLFRDFMRHAPRELSAFFAFLIVPPGPPFPQDLWGSTVCAIMCCCLAEPAAAEEMTLPLREFGPPLVSLLHPMPYPFLQSIFDGLLPPGLHHYWKADFARDLSEDAIAAHVRFGPAIPNIHSALHIYPMDGAIHDVAAGATAFPHRDVRFVHIIAAVTPHPQELASGRNWVREYWAALHPHSAGASYSNFLMDEGEERVASSYGVNQARLAAIKTRYDPANLFRLNQNIRPAN